MWCDYKQIQQNPFVGQCWFKDYNDPHRDNEKLHQTYMLLKPTVTSFINNNCLKDFSSCFADKHKGVSSLAVRLYCWFYLESVSSVDRIRTIFLPSVKLQNSPTDWETSEAERFQFWMNCPFKLLRINAKWTKPSDLPITMRCWLLKFQELQH